MIFLECIGSRACLSASQVFIVGLTKFWRDAGVVDRAALEMR